jgi:hypothetical protein
VKLEEALEEIICPTCYGGPYSLFCQVCGGIGLIDIYVWDGEEDIDLSEFSVASQDET